MTHAWLDAMRTTTSPLVEKMTLFWHGHFCSALDAVESHEMMWEQNQLFRTMGLGSFRDLTQAVSLGPAMLRYLDNDKNVVGSPNENCARELMELFTLGVNEYTQDDIAASARAWTGHGLDKNGKYAFTAKRHDAKPKTFFGVTKNWDGPEIIDEILLGQKQEIAARFLATKLWSFFAYPDPEPQVVDFMVAGYLSSGLQVREMLRAMFVRPEFYSERAVRQLVRSPIEWVVVAMRGTGMSPAEAHPEWWLEAMGQQPFYPPNVAGWKQNAYWISSSAEWAKFAFAGYIRWEAQKRGVLADTNRLPVPDAVRAGLRQFGVLDPSLATVAAMEHWLRGERTSTKWAEQPNLIMLSLLSPDAQLA
jgi:uncharacterized protein (DUF1800 family)